MSLNVNHNRFSSFMFLSISPRLFNFFLIAAWDREGWWFRFINLHQIINRLFVQAIICALNKFTRDDVQPFFLNYYCIVRWIILYLFYFCWGGCAITRVIEKEMILNWIAITRQNLNARGENSFLKVELKIGIN